MTTNKVEGKRNPYDLFNDTTRSVQMEPLYVLDEQNQPVMYKDEYGNESPRLKGLGLHMHSTATTYSEDGITTSAECDYVVLDIMQVAGLKAALSHVDFHEDGE